MIEYVVGIVTDQENRALLVRKNRPTWQKGMLNGVGGHLEPNESPYEAMMRECKEESNLCLTNWSKLGTVTDKEFYKVFYFHSNVVDFGEAKPLTDEVIEIINLDCLDYSQVVQPTDVFIRLALSPIYKSFDIIQK